jgi:hypothetical protein
LENTVSRIKLFGRRSANSNTYLSITIGNSSQIKEGLFVWRGMQEVTDAKMSFPASRGAPAFIFSSPPTPQISFPSSFPIQSCRYPKHPQIMAYPSHTISTPAALAKQNITLSKG